MNPKLEKLIKISKLIVLIFSVYLIILFVANTPANNIQNNDTVFFRKSVLTNSTSNWVINGRYSKDETECIENCMRQGGINCGGVLYFACCQSQEHCMTYPLGITRCTEILPNFRCFMPS